MSSGGQRAEAWASREYAMDRARAKDSSLTSVAHRAPCFIRVRREIRANGSPVAKERTVLVSSAWIAGYEHQLPLKHSSRRSRASQCVMHRKFHVEIYCTRAWAYVSASFTERNYLNGASTDLHLSCMACAAR